MPKQLRAHTPVNQVPIQPSITSVAPTPTPQPIQPVKFSGRVNEFENDHFVVSERQERDVDDRSLYRTVHVPESRGAVSPIRNTLWGTCVLKLVSQQQAFTPHVQEVPQQPQRPTVEAHTLAPVTSATRLVLQQGTREVDRRSVVPHVEAVKVPSLPEVVHDSRPVRSAPVVSVSPVVAPTVAPANTTVISPAITPAITPVHSSMPVEEDVPNMHSPYPQPVSAAPSTSSLPARDTKVPSPPVSTVT